MKLRILVADDEPLARTLICSLAERDPQLDVVSEASDGGKALRDIERIAPDVVFLDVQMPPPNGIEVAEHLATLARPPHVIFVTAYAEHAVRAFELHALDYLVKPIQRARFSECMARAKAVIRNGELSSLSERWIAMANEYQASSSRHGGVVVRKSDRLEWIEIDDVVWVEAANQYVEVHTRTETFTVSESLGSFLKRSSHPNLVRIHRSAAVNTDCIERIHRKPNGTHEIHLTSGTAVPLSRRRRSLLPSLLRLAHRR